MGNYFDTKVFITVFLVLFAMWAFVHVVAMVLGPPVSTTVNNATGSTTTTTGV